MYKNQNLRKIVRRCGSVIGQSVLIATGIILIASPLSCHVTTQGIEFTGGDYVAPKLESYKVIDENHIKLCFSENVKVSGASISEDIIVSKVQCCNEENTVTLEFNNNSVIGKTYVLSGVVEDKYGNSLTFSLPFDGYNKHVPKMLITEFQSKHKNYDDKQVSCEYVELMALEDGNLFGLMIGSVGTKEKNDYSFPPVEVKKGELIVVHLRKKGEGCISEDGDNLNLATSKNASSIVRDLWSENESSALGTNDVIYLVDKINNEYIDGLAYTDPEKTEWSDENKAKVEELYNGGVVASRLVGDAINIDNNTETKSLNRKDAVLIRDKVMKGEDVSMMLKYNKDSWEQRQNNAGTLE